MRYFDSGKRDVNFLIGNQAISTADVFSDFQKIIDENKAACRVGLMARAYLLGMMDGKRAARAQKKGQNMEG